MRCILPSNTWAATGSFILRRRTSWANSTSLAFSCSGPARRAYIAKRAACPCGTTSKAAFTERAALVCEASRRTCGTRRAPTCRSCPIRADRALDATRGCGETSSFTRYAIRQSKIRNRPSEAESARTASRRGYVPRRTRVTRVAAGA